MGNGRRAPRRPAQQPSSARCLRGRAAALSARFLWLLLLPGCAAPEQPGARRAAPAPGYAETGRLIPLHPAAAELRALDGEIARIRARVRAGKPDAAGPVPVPAPRAVTLPEVPVPAAASLAGTGIDLRRARQAVHEDYEIRRLEQQLRIEQEFEAEQERLREEAAGAPAPPQETGGGVSLEPVTRDLDAIRRLEQELRELEEGPADRLFFKADELARRRARFEQVQVELARRRQEYRERLRQALARRPRVERPRAAEPVPVPPALLAAAQARKEARLREAMAALRQQETAEVERLAQRALPTLPPAVERELPREELGAARESMRETVLALPGAPAPGPRGAAGRETLAELTERRARLAARVAAEVKAAAAAAGREAGVQVTFERREAVDRTAELVPRVREMLAVRSAGGTAR